MSRSGVAPHPTGGYRYWRGASGRRYVHTVFALNEWPDYTGALVLFVRGGTEVLWIGQSSPLTGLFGEPGLLARMQAQGAEEIHVHLLAETRAERSAAERDLKAALLR
jgi:hypothetical protein